MNKFKLSLLLLCILAFACTKENEEVEQIYAPEVKLVENWYATEFNAEKHQFLTYAKAPDWSKAVVSCTELSYVVEVPLLLNPDVKVISEDRLTQNIQMRLLFFCEGEDYSTAIAFIASQSNATDFLANTNNINYNYIDKGFNGMVNIFNLEQEMLETNLFVEGERNNFNSTLKSMQKDCYQIVEVFSDGSTKPVSAIYCTDNDLAGGGGGGDYGGHEGPRDPGANPAPKIIEDPSFQNHKCASSILYTLKTGKSSYEYDGNSDQFVNQNNLAEKIMNFFNNNSVFNVTYTLGNLSGANGNCSKVSNNANSYIITIDNNYIEKATDLSVARTIIHETIHAHLLYVTYAMNYNDKQNSKEWIALNSIFNNQPLNNSNNAIQHEYMAGIVNLIGNCLYDWAYANNKNITRDYCSKLAWGGLLNTAVFNQKVSNGELSKSEIEGILLNEQENYNNAKGATCTK